MSEPGKLSLVKSSQVKLSLVKASKKASKKESKRCHAISSSRGCFLNQRTEPNRTSKIRVEPAGHKVSPIQSNPAKQAIQSNPIQSKQSNLSDSSHTFYCKLLATGYSVDHQPTTDRRDATCRSSFSSQPHLISSPARDVTRFISTHFSRFLPPARAVPCQCEPSLA